MAAYAQYEADRGDGSNIDGASSVQQPSFAEHWDFCDSWRTSHQEIERLTMKNGQVVGHQNEVRVFDVQHIKGLEFEAVFFVDLDQLPEQKADLFPSYLYVGSTRAATYLGITCRMSLPPLLRPIKSSFTSHWKS